LPRELSRSECSSGGDPGYFAVVGQHHANGRAPGINARENRLGRTDLGFLHIDHCQCARRTRTGTAGAIGKIAGGRIVARISRIRLFICNVEITAVPGKREPAAGAF